MTTYGIQCFAVLIAYLAVVVVTRLLFGIQAPRALSVAALFGAIHFCAWRFVKVTGRDLLPNERWRFMLACFVAYWVFDDLLPLARGLMAEGANLFREVVIGVVATLVGLVIVAIIVYVTVPWATRLYARRSVA